jgi:hypothetical protein
MGYSGARRFVSEETSADQKQGTATASQAALLGLEEEIALEEAKPAKELAQLFPEKIDIYESNKTNWNYFWNHKPTIVGIDTEGNQISPPVLVQISTDDYTIIEVPSKGKGLSKNLSRLLSDETITKVFCDNFAHKDKISLGATDIPKDLTVGHIVDLEAIAATSMGTVKVARGLSRIISLSMSPTCQIRKPNAKGRMANVGQFSWIEQGKAPPLKSMYDFSVKELDWWCTLQAYKSMQEQQAMRES